MGEITQATWRTYVHGQEVELPATIDGIRASLPQESRAEFDAEIGQVPAAQLQQVLGRWALRTHPGAAAATEDAFRQLETGTFTDGVPLDDDGSDQAGAA
ncbi:hypothetical protein GCM10023347_07310 [Streptomyces chumphonensis]|uniref:Uncharacterized protein n=1 Tax=Streptomyces chumphonensis TaxID=1214925 RepID=A0A927ID96_9ACTN|nr:hypothetical protein [Streptomyces chumphonensis]MBD3934873.1 hypothetical protein [Streptomyces chumphonensis]